MLAVALAALASAPLAMATAGGRAATIAGPAGTTTVRLDRDRLLSVAGRVGTVSVRVSEGRVRVTGSDCPDHVCVRSGAARPGRPVVCAPNGVVVSVGGESDVDAVSR